MGIKHFKTAEFDAAVAARLHNDNCGLLGRLVRPL